MSKITIIVLGVFVGIAVLAISLFGWFISVKNRQVALREQYDASQKVIQTAHDNMWKTIQQKYNVANTYKDGFNESVRAVVQGRTGGALFKSVQENMPGLTPEMYKEVMATIEGKRDMLRNSMNTSVDIARTYNTFVQSAPQSWILDNTKIDARIITSGKTSDAYQSGQDDDITIK